MPAIIDSIACIGCGVCSTICPSDVIHIDKNTSKAIVLYPKDCTNCRLCERNCSFYAIRIPGKIRSKRPFTFSLYLEGLGVA